MPIPLSQAQFLAIANAAACLYPGDRDPFIAAVAAELHGLPIGDGTVGRVIRAVQGRFHHPEPEPIPRWSREAPRFDRASKRACQAAAVSYWCAAQLQPQRDRLALHFLEQAGFETYAPRLRERRPTHGRVVARTPLLFPGYLFILIKLQWNTARWAPGVVRIVMDGASPARVPEAVLAGIRAREVGGLVELPRPSLKPGARLRVMGGPFEGHVGLYAGMRPRERVEVLLAILGGQQRVELPRGDVEAV